MLASIRFLTAMVLPVAFASSVFAAEPLHARIDRLIAAGQKGHEKEIAARSTDAEFLRRAYLDLAGTIPTAKEARAFLDSKDATKRAQLLDQLLASPGYARRMAQYFDVVLMERRQDSKVSRADWEAYLVKSFGENRPYDLFVREILSSDGVDPKKRAPAKFYLDRDFEPNLVTRDIARIFLGRNLQCAQCHDHPLITAYKQSEYFGIFAFLNRTFLFPNAKSAKAVLAEKAEGEVNFVSVFDKAKKQKTTLPRVMTGKAFEEPKLAKGKEYKVAGKKGVRPVPAYSRREKLALAMTSSTNPYFARAAANRLWALMLGRGIVDPVDLDHAANPPSHPELLDLLAKEFAAHKFDVKWLLREIALSQTYQRSSELPTGVSEPAPELYLVGLLKPLSAEQLAYGSSQATGPVQKAPAMKTPARSAAAALSRFRNLFGGQPGAPASGETTNLDQTLFLKFGSAFRGMAANGGLSKRLAQLQDAGALADELFLSVYSRRPTAEEKKDVAQALEGMNRTGDINELVWALLASSEFRFNH